MIWNALNVFFLFSVLDWIITRWVTRLVLESWRCSGRELVTTPLLRERITFPLRSMLAHFTDIALCIPHWQTSDVCCRAIRPGINQLELCSSRPSSVLKTGGVFCFFLIIIYLDTIKFGLESVVEVENGERDLHQWSPSIGSHVPAYLPPWRL